MLPSRDAAVVLLPSTGTTGGLSLQGSDGWMDTLPIGWMDELNG